MAEATTTDTTGPNSPAKQMLAALTRASQEMTRTVNESCEHVENLNALLESKVNEHLKEANAYAELVIRGQLSGLSHEKNGILAELSELQREELKVLQGIGKKLREEMSRKLEEIVAEISKQLDGKLSAFTDSLSESEKETEAKILQAIEDFRRYLPSHIESINKKVESEKDHLGELAAGHEEFFNNEVAETISKFQEHFSVVKTQLDNAGETASSAALASFETLVQNAENSIEKCSELVSDMKEESKNRIYAHTESDINDLKNLIEPFEKSIKQATEIQSALHSTYINNLALEYRTEVFTLSKEAEDLIQRARMDLHSAINSQRDSFTEQADKLFLDFDKALREIPIKKNVEGESSQKDIAAQMKQILDDLRTKIHGSAEQKSSEAKEFAVKAFDEASSDINKVAKDVSSQIENDLQFLSTEISELKHENEKAFEKLNEKMQSLELLVDEARQLISALGDSGLEFEE